MIAWARRQTVTFVLAGAVALAAVSGFLASQAIGSTEQATRTVTVDVAGPGPPGPAGPAGPPGPQGAPGPAGIVCPEGFSEAEVVFIQQGRGPTTLFTCLKD